MAFAVASLWFLCVGTIGFFVGWKAIQRYLVGKERGDRFAWQAGRIWLAACAALSALDSYRIFFGGFWSDTTEAPWLAYIIYPLITAHLICVPFLMLPTTSYIMNIRTWKAEQAGETASKEDSPWETRSWILTALLCSALAGCGVLNTIARMAGTTELERGEAAGGIVTWMLVELEVAHEKGYTTVSPELMGVFGFAFWSVLCSICILRRTGDKVYFGLQMFCLFGQGAGAPLGPWFSFLSNPLEQVAFASMVYADQLLLEPSTKSQDAELFAGVGIGG